MVTRAKLEGPDLFVSPQGWLWFAGGVMRVSGLSLVSRRVAGFLKIAIVEIHAFLLQQLLKLLDVCVCKRLARLQL